MIRASNQPFARKQCFRALNQGVERPAQVKLSMRAVSLAEQFQSVVDQSSRVSAGPDYYWQFSDVNAFGSAPTGTSISDTNSAVILGFIALLESRVVSECKPGFQFEKYDRYR